MVDGIKLLSAGLDDRDGEIIAHGWLDIDSIKQLLVDDYQREVLSRQGRRGKIATAVSEGARLPDIMLGMRGENFSSQKDTMVLQDKVYIIDGLQRVSAMLQAAEEDPELLKKLRIGAEVRFSTSRAKERDLFLVLNGSRIPVSPNVILRNIRDSNKAVLTLYGLSNTDPRFALRGKVQWDQRQTRGQLATALTLVKAGNSLHRHIRGYGPRNSVKVGGTTGPIHLASALETKATNIGLAVFRHNMTELFDAIDKAWGIRNVEYTEMAAQLKSNFIMTLSRLFSDHDNFWDGDKLSVETVLIKKLGTFPLQDPHMARLAASGSQTLPILYNYMRDHMNKGKRTNKLVPRKEPASKDIDDTE